MRTRSVRAEAEAATFTLVERRPHFIAKHRTGPRMRRHRVGMGTQLTGNNLADDVFGQADEVFV
ncbi:MAG: hypothetical protein ACP5EO_14140, partial [Acidithiobacillus sp.]